MSFVIRSRQTNRPGSTASGTAGRAGGCVAPIAPAAASVATANVAAIDLRIDMIERTGRYHDELHATCHRTDRRGVAAQVVGGQRTRVYDTSARKTRGSEGPSGISWAPPAFRTTGVIQLLVS